MKELTFKDAQNNLSEIMTQVTQDNTPRLISSLTGASCVLISGGEYESLEETAYLLGSSANARHLFNSIDELRAEREVG